MNYKYLLLIVAAPVVVRAQSPTAQKILNKSIQYHDPRGVWPTLNQVLRFDEVQPDGTIRTTMAEIDNNRGYFRLNRGNTEIIGMLLDSCFLEKGSYDCARAEMMRNYYLYLWGLPMKLLDKGTPLDNIMTEEEYEGKSCHVLRVKYEKDTWYYFIDKADFRLLAYKFYQDEEETKGELIKLDEEMSVSGMRIPKKRSWYTIPENKFLGTDILTGSTN